MKRTVLRLALLATSVTLLQYSLGLEPGQKRGATFYGINEDPCWNFKPHELPLFSDLLKQTGCGAIRIPLRWSLVEPRENAWDFTRFDQAVQAIPANVEILGTLMSVPAWANGMTQGQVTGWVAAYPPDAAHQRNWTQYVAKVVQHFKARIHHWEIWNEENGVDFYRPLPDAHAYTELLKGAYQAAKQADPGCVVVLGGLQMDGVIPNPWSQVKTPHYLEDLYQAGAGPYFDVGNIHPYVSPNEGAARMLQMVRNTLAVMARYGDSTKPLWITEEGCGAASPKAQEAQAKLLRDAFAAAQHEPRIQRMFWFLLRDMRKDIVGPTSSMGLFSHQGEIKPAGRAMQQLIK